MFYLFHLELTKRHLTVQSTSDASKSAGSSALPPAPSPAAASVAAGLTAAMRERLVAIERTLHGALGAAAHADVRLSAASEVSVWLRVF